MVPGRAAMVTPLPSMDPVVHAVENWLAANYVDPDAPLLVACSGGADSMALASAVLTATAREGRASGTGQVARSRAVAAAIIDHGLQQGSATIASDAAETVHAMGYRRVMVRRVSVGMDGGMESAARDARYAALASIAEGAPVLLAHTADDQAETVLLGLGRGSGPRSIAGMRPWTAPWGRPLLSIRREETERACAAIGIDPWMDPHNINPEFTRVRLRREVVPLLDEVLSGGVVGALARTAELMADDLAALDAVADRVLAETLGDDGDLDCRGLSEWPSAVRRRVLRTWVRQQSGITALTYRHLVALEDSVIQGHSGRAVRLPGGIDAVRSGKRLHLPATASDAAPGDAPGCTPRCVEVAGWQA